MPPDRRAARGVMCPPHSAPVGRGALSSGEKLMPRMSLVLVFSCVAALVAACSPIGMAVGAGATAGVAAFQERPIGEAMDDAGIKLGLTDRLIKSDGDLFGDVSSKVMEGRVMLTGLVSGEQERAEATRLAWSIEGVREVINEIEVADRSTFEAMPGDTWIDTKLRARLLTDFSISDINYSTDVVNGSVYILGIGRDPTEIDRVAAHARDISGVRRVVMHAITVDDSRRLASRPPSAPAPEPFRREPSGDRQGHVLTEAQPHEDLLTGQAPLRKDFSAYENTPAIETASTQPAYYYEQPAYQPPAPAPAAAASSGGPRSLAPQDRAAVESRALAPIR